MPDTAIPMGQRIAAVVEYDGSAYHGWQLQAGHPVQTVQGALEGALAQVADEPVRVMCAGRTDTGVHATHQVVHFDAPAARSPRSWLLGANVHLPDTVVVRGVQWVKDDFHARFSATARRYRYLILNTNVASAVAASKLNWLRYELSVPAMHRAAQALLGEQDFSAFRAASCQSATPMRHLNFVNVSRYGEIVVIDIEANAFLHHMVRNIVGALIAVGRGRLGESEMGRLLASKDRTQAPDTAAAAGLYLVGVSYPVHFGVTTYSPGPVFLNGVD